MFEHRLSGLAIQMWALKRRGNWYGVHRSHTLDACDVLHNLKHTLRQGHRDLKRRGKSNREGAKNRRWRKWKAAQPKDPHVLIWPDYAIDRRDFAA